ncbi:GNAT family N-acetyltransferase [Chroogloeocystis siderophila]|jgi:predicted GNAT family N-acyltransferase|uniref:GNAT family N-acetyltransferase n=1 Tax=Chroogloeocystis siderophila 5.2 s.c.1 TaxID=247279 RepID=A0A1U7HS30_9CHRO|nr:GNAT family N-acetyltransferase [Chroogloeocystis siderophila]OKH26396.1 GNAT family N-acetyltransferase [Chroogloeocystis siderophila 5.2 s.c.1]
MSIVIKTAELQEWQSIQEIRRVVFQEEQGVDTALEFDGKDDTAEQLIAYRNAQPVGTARIRYLDTKTAKIERLAVLSTARGQGIGKQLMQKAIERAIAQKMQEAVIHAQEYVKALYQQLGFVQEGETFDEAGIPHVKMRRKLTSNECD